MVTVALAGATTGLGLTMLRVFLTQNTSHKIILLSRSEQPQLASQGVDVRPVDYSDHQSLVSALHGVHTVLSVIGGGAPGKQHPQIALLEAAKEAGVTRFAPSEYAGQGYEGIDLYQGKALVWEAVKTSGLEYTRFSCGLFTNILATGTPKPPTEHGRSLGIATGEQEALAGVRPWNFVINMAGGTADYAADGTAPVVFTEMHDVALFVLQALDLKTWPEELGMRGDVKSFVQVVEIVERVQERKFLTRENSVQELQAKVEDPGKRFYNQGRLAIAKGWAVVQDDLNHLTDVKPVTVEQFVEKWWRGVELGAPAWGEDRSFM